MSLTAGTRLGPYEIAALIGAGGMGEVYQESNRLNRPPILGVVAWIDRAAWWLSIKRLRLVGVSKRDHQIVDVDRRRRPIVGAKQNEVAAVIDQESANRVQSTDCNDFIG